MFKTPRQLPPLSLIIDSLDSRAPRDIAKYLGVSERSVYGWLAAEQCPRPAHLALFWVSRWGASHINVEAINGERWARGHARALERELSAIRRSQARPVPALFAANDAAFETAAQMPLALA